MKYVHHFLYKFVQNIRSLRYVVREFLENPFRRYRVVNVDGQKDTRTEVNWLAKINKIFIF
jgi:hypothetical protein